MSESRRRAVGAEIVSGGVDFRVWAPAHSRVAVVFASGSSYELRDEGDGYFPATVAAARAGTCYRFQLDDSIASETALLLKPEV